jgi:hypothetical protein
LKQVNGRPPSLDHNRLWSAHPLASFHQMKGSVDLPGYLRNQKRE